MTTLDTRPRSAAPADLAARFVVRAATRAPSVHNTQPWRFAAHGDTVRLYADGGRRLPWSDPAGRELVISCGAALFNLRLAMRHLGFAARLTVFPDPREPDLLAEVRWGRHEPPSAHEELLFRTIGRRRTHRGPFTRAAVPKHRVDDLRAAAAREGAGLLVVSDGARIRRLAALVAAAERTQQADPRVALELARWAPEPGVRQLDGVPPHAYPRQPDGAGFAGRGFALGSSPGHASGGPPPYGSLGTVAVLRTRGDRPADWLRSGMALQAVLLRATAHQIGAAFHTQPLEIPELRAGVEQVIAHGHPQLLLRLGYTARVRTTPRRPVTEVLARG